MLNLLVVDDNVQYLDTVKFLLERHYKITTALGGRMALKCIDESFYDVILLDLEMPEIDGFQVLSEIKKKDRRTPVIIISQHTHYEKVVRAIKLGADTFVEKGFEQKLLITKIEQLLEQRRVSLQADRKTAQYREKFGTLVCASEEMKKIDDMITRFAELDVDVFLFGESGVGKDMLAYQLHARSKRSDDNYVHCSLSQMPENLVDSEIFGHKKGAFTGAVENKVGKIEIAHNGTLYFPEITDIPESVQLKLLQFFDSKVISVLGYSGSAGEKQINARVITATNADPLRLIETKALREDFFYRINTVAIQVPPLRERVEDILPLSRFFITMYQAHTPSFADIFLSAEVEEWFVNYSWPGNVRQLKNTVLAVLSRALLFNQKKAGLQCLPALFLEKGVSSGKTTSEIRKSDILPFKEAEEIFVREYFKNLLMATNKNITEAALLAGQDKRTIYNYINRFGLNNKSGNKTE